MSAHDVYIFVDRSDAQLEYAYVIGQKGVFAQVSTFPGYDDRRFYLSLGISEQSQNIAKEWEKRTGEITPPFMPGGPWFSRTAICTNSTQPGETSYFKDTNIALRKWLVSLRGEVVAEKYRVEKPPEWVTADQRITNRLGMQ